MSNTPLKDSLAQVAKDPLNPSYADALTFMQSIREELRSLGVPDFKDIKARANNIPILFTKIEPPPASIVSLSFPKWRCPRIGSFPYK